MKRLIFLGIVLVLLASVGSVSATVTIASLPFNGSTQIQENGTPQIAVLACVKAANAGIPGTLTTAMKNVSGTNTGVLLAAVYGITSDSVPGSGNCTPNLLIATSASISLASLTGTFVNYTFTFNFFWNTVSENIAAGQGIAVGILDTAGNFIQSKSPTADTGQESDSCSFNVNTFRSVNCGTAIQCGANACPSYTFTSAPDPGPGSTLSGQTNPSLILGQPPILIYSLIASVAAGSISVVALLGRRSGRF